MFLVTPLVVANFGITLNIGYVFKTLGIEDDVGRSVVGINDYLFAADVAMSYKETAGSFLSACRQGNTLSVICRISFHMHRLCSVA